MKINFYITLIVFLTFSCHYDDSNNNSQIIEDNNYKSDIDDSFNKENKKQEVEKSSLPRNKHVNNYQLLFEDISFEQFNSLKNDSLKHALNIDNLKDITIEDSCYFIKNNDATIDTLCDNLENDFSDEYIDYYLKDCWDDYGCYVFETIVYEELIYFIHNSNNGKRTYTWQLPVLSPAKQLFFTSSYDLVSGFQTSGIQLFEIVNNEIIKVYELETLDWGPQNSQWVSNNQIIFERITLDSEDYTITKKEYTLLTIQNLAN